MNTLHSVLPFDVSGLGLAAGGLLRALSALLPDLALKGAVLLLVALAVDAGLRRASAATRHAHWQLALGGTLLLALLAPLLPHVPLPLPLPASLFASDATAAPPSGDAPRAGAAEPALRDEAPAAVRVPLRQRRDALAGGAQHAVDGVRPADEQHLAVTAELATSAGAGRDVSASTGTSASTSNGTSASASASANASAGAGAGRSAWSRLGAAVARLGVGGWLTLAWATGAAIVLALLAWSLLRARALARSARPLHDAEWLALLDRTAGELSLKRRVTLLVADGPVVPMTWGFSRPVILLPADAQQWSAPRRRQVLLHELAHIQRGDWLTQILAQLACALYWYQPLCWLAARRLRLQREHACDDRVLAAGNRASDYAGHLLEIARTRQVGLTGSFATLAMARPSQLEGRLLAVLDERRNRRALPGRSTLAAAAVTGSLVLALACVQPQAADEQQAVVAPAGQFTATAAPAPGEPAAPLPTGGGAPAAREIARDSGHVVLTVPLVAPAANLALAAPVRAGAAWVPQQAPAAWTPQPAPAAWVGVRHALRAAAQAPLAALAAGQDAFAAAGPAAVAPQARGSVGAQAGPLPPRPALAPLAPIAPVAQMPPTPEEAADPFGTIPGWDLHFGWGEDSQQQWAWSENGNGYKVTLKGSAEADETGTRLVALIDDASLVIERTHDGATETLTVTGTRDETTDEPKLKYSGLVGGAADPAHPEAQNEALVALVVAHTGMFARERINWLLAHGGVAAVLKEAGAQPDEDVRATWYEALLGEHELTTADVGTAFTQAAHDLPTDAQMAALLQAVGPELLADPDLVAPLFAAADTLESDATQAEVLQCLLNGEYVDGPVLARGLASATTGLESDAFMAQVLGEVQGVRLRDPAVRSAFLAALDTVGSDAYAAQIVEPLLDQRGVKGETLAALVAQAGKSIDSDSYLAQVLAELPERSLADTSIRAAAMTALGTVESDAYLAEVLGAWLEADDLPPSALGDLLDAATHGLDSDASMTEVLSHVPQAAASDTTLRPHVDAAVATIESPSYREQALEELGLGPKDA